MKWLEGWFGFAGGVIGVLLTLLTALLAPVHTAVVSQVQVTVGGPMGGATTYTGTDGSSTIFIATPVTAPPPTPVTSTPPGPDLGALVLILIVTLLFIGVLVGVWLDLANHRLMGRLLLLNAITLLIPGLIVESAYNSSFTFGWLCVVAALIAGVVACLRPTPARPAWISAPTTPPAS